MSGMSAQRAHLAERAVAAMGTLTGGATMAAETPAISARLAPRQEAPRNAESFAAPPQPVAAPTPPIGLEALRAAGLAFEPEAATRSRLQEELALIQHQLLRAMPPLDAPRNATAGRQLVMVTSARADEGKSFMALNLAASLAAGTGQAVVLVDVDGGATRRLGVEDAPGLRALARDPGQPVSLLLRGTAIPGLSVLPQGARGPDEALPTGAALAVALRALAAALPRHVVLLDMPAALASSDAPALAATVGQVLLVVRAESTPREAVEAALDVLESCPTLQLVLNQSRLNTDDSFGEATGGADG